MWKPIPTHAYLLHYDYSGQCHLLIRDFNCHCLVGPAHQDRASECSSLLPKAQGGQRTKPGLTDPNQGSFPLHHISPRGSKQESWTVHTATTQALNALKDDVVSVPISTYTSDQVTLAFNKFLFEYWIPSPLQFRVHGSLNILPWSALSVALKIPRVHLLNYVVGDKNL